MASYVSVEELKRDALPQLLDTSDQNAALQTYLDAATAIINTEVGYSFALATPATVTVYGDGTDFLTLPPLVPGSVTGVTAPYGATIPTYVERDGFLVVTRTNVIGRPTFWEGGGWTRGGAYAVTADFGYSADVMAVVQQCCREIAVRLWRFKDAGGSEVIGVEGAGAVQVKNQFSPLVERMLRRIDEASTAPDVGVW